jgi:hypothetical protein
VKPKTPFVVVLLLAVLVGCGSNYRQRAIKAGVQSVNTARDGFVKWDHSIQSEIVKRATSREEVEYKLKAYRTARLFVLDVFELVYRSLAVAATETDDASLNEALKQIQKLFKALKALKEDLRWQPGWTEPNSSSKPIPQHYTA